MDKTQQPEISYPCEWTYTIIGSEPEKMREDLREILPIEQYSIFDSKKSSKGNYVSYTIPVKVTTPDNLKALYQKIGALDCVKHVI